MVLRWAAAAYLETEKHFRRIMGYKCPAWGASLYGCLKLP